MGNRPLILLTVGLAFLAYVLGQAFYQRLTGNLPHPLVAIALGAATAAIIGRWLTRER